MRGKGLDKNFILLNVGYAYHDADWNWKEVNSPFIRIHYVKKGQAKIIRDDGEQELREGNLYLTPSYVKHSYECNGILELYYIHLYEDPGSELSIFELIDFPVEVVSSRVDLFLIERLININPGRELKHYDPKTYNDSSTLAQNIALQGKSPLANEMETRGIVNVLFSRFLAPATYKKEHLEERVLKCLLHIHRNLDKQVDIDQLAAICCLTKDHFIRLFNKEMHCTPRKYINRKKIEAAQLKLLIEDTSIKEIAFGLGFDNVSYFNRLFNKLTGESPGQYRKRMQT